MTGVQADEVRERHSMLRFPTGRYPTGWFQVGWSDEIANKEVRLLHYFGQDIALWRTESGRLHALDAHCLHFGANLAVQGTVDGEDIVCPWHGWHWNGDGKNTLVPYDNQQCKENLCAKVWPLREWGGLIVLWHDRAGRPPDWELPALEDVDRGDYFPFEKTVWRIKAHVQNPLENAADPAHIVYVHGAGEIPEYLEYRFDGPQWTGKMAAAFGAGKESTWLTPRGPESLVLDLKYFGIGIAVTRWPELFNSAIYIGNTTPVDDTTCDHFFSMTTQHKGAVDPPPLHARVIETQKAVTQMDFFTWENMKVLETPNLTPMETKYLYPLRRWARQFYPESADD